MTTVAVVLAAARTRLPAAEGRMLLGHVLRRPAVWLLANDDCVLDEAQRDQFAMLVARRRGGEPMAYLTGSREFYGREFAVAPGTLIPRPETELLVDIARSRVSLGGTAPARVRVVDLGTGSGCIAISLALECPHAEVVAIDRSTAALEIARRNASRHHAQVDFRQGDWLAGLGDLRFDLVVSNPPYIAEGDPHLAQGDLRFEPREALASGADGLDAIRYIVGAAPRHLLPGGWLFVEHGYDQARAVADLLETTGYSLIEQHCDLAGIVRVSGGRWVLAGEIAKD